MSVPMSPTGPAPYYTDGTVTLYRGDMREVLPTLGIEPDCVIADPPYGETSLEWDRWPSNWPGFIARFASSMWCFGSMRMFLDRGAELAKYWNLSQDVVWRKGHGPGIAADRFRRVHEHVLHWYRGGWNLVYKDPQRAPYDGRDSRHGYSRSGADGHTGALKSGYRWVDDGTRLVTSVIEVPSMWRRGAVHPTEKPVGIIDPLIRYACPPGGTVLDQSAGRGSTAVAPRLGGRRAVLTEAHEGYRALIARRLSQDVLPLGGVPA